METRHEGIRDRTKSAAVGKSKPRLTAISTGAPARSSYGTPRRAPKMRRGTAEERAAFADEIRAKTKLFGDGQ